ncbi:MAG TPA: GNAT family N-acetyltransferase [Thermoanaerobaculia bacterium]|nr:GNAT family N-acetyltransferase [Thermoanaerobaculia bacterium]
MAAHSDSKSLPADPRVTTAEDLLAGGSAPEASEDGIVILGPLRPLGEVLATARRLLRDKGRLLIPLLPDGLTAREIVIALSEAGFVILEPQRGADASGPYVARKESFFVREYRAGDEEQILPLFRKSFYVDRSLERWGWEYRENPHGALKISEAFSEDGRLVAHYAGYPVRFHSETGGAVRTFPALQIGDTMTEPSVRQVGRGPTSLLGRTVRHYYARFCEGQVAFNYGFNTGNIQRFSMSFVGARRLEDLPFHVLDLEKTPLRPPNPFLSRLAGYRVERIACFDGRWDEFFHRVSGAYRLLVERDARYLEWRYARVPDSEYFLYAVFRRGRLVGWSVFAYKGEGRLRWGDALFDPRHPGAVHEILARVLAAPEHRQAKTVETWATSRPAWWRERLVALGFEPRPEPEALGFVFVPFEHDPEEDFRAHLYYTMGDSDLF